MSSLLLAIGLLFSSEQEMARKMQAHLLLHHPEEALKGTETEAVRDLQIAKLRLSALALLGEETQLLREYELFRDHFPEEADSYEVLEEVCWGILRRGERASATATRFISFLGHAFSQDIKGEQALLEALSNSHSALRALAVEFAVHYRSEALKEELSRLFQSETHEQVRLKLIEAFVELKKSDELPALYARMEQRKLSHRERAALAMAVAELEEGISEEMLRELAHHSKGALRMSAAASIAQWEKREQQPLLEALLVDPLPEVRLEALRAWGQLRLPPIEPLLRASKERDPEVGVMGAWALLLVDQAAGEEGLRQRIASEDSQERLLAAGAIRQGGRRSAPLAEELFLSDLDPYVKANLACHLIEERKKVEEAAAYLIEFLQSHSERLMWQEEPFKILKKSDVAHSPLVPNYPEAVNQAVRLELLNLLAHAEVPRVQEAMRAFLLGRPWQVTGVAAELLLTEGEGEVLELVRSLLEDEDPRVRSEAALVLATVGKDRAAIPILLELYPKADRLLKIQILEALSRVRDPHILPFLKQQLKDPSQTLRLLSATVLILTLRN